eukprot:g69776.t1
MQDPENALRTVTSNQAKDPCHRRMPLLPRLLLVTLLLLLLTLWIGVKLLPQPRAERPKPPARQSWQKPRGQLLNDQLAWFTQRNGRLHPNVTFQPLPELPQVWGLFATGYVAKGEQIVHVPRDLLLSSQHALGFLLKHLDDLHAVSSLPAERLTAQYLLQVLGYTGSLHKLDTADSQESWKGQGSQEVLALYIYLYRDQPTNFFYHYLATLPQGCQNPQCWSEDRLSATFAKKVVEEQQQKQQRARAVAGKLGIEAELFLECLSQVVSRRSWELILTGWLAPDSILMLV